MAKGIVGGNISHDGVQYAKGDVIEADKDVIAALMEAGALVDPKVQEAVDKTAKADTAEAESKAQGIIDEATKKAKEIAETAEADADEQAKKVTSEAIAEADKLVEDAKAEAAKIVKDAQEAASNVPNAKPATAAK